jgi:ribosomal protein S27E
MKIVNETELGYQKKDQYLMVTCPICGQEQMVSREQKKFNCVKCSTTFGISTTTIIEEQLNLIKINLRKTERQLEKIQKSTIETNRPG